jgi:hypothetical protein
VSISMEQPPVVAPEERQCRDSDRANRRIAVRVVCHVPASACALGRVDTLARWATIKDQSPQGIGILAPRLYEVGTVLFVWTEARNVEPPILARVVHTRAESNGIFHGCKKLWETDITG